MPMIRMPMIRAWWKTRQVHLSVIVVRTDPPNPTQNPTLTTGVLGTQESPR